MKLIGDRPLTAAERQRRYRAAHPERVKASQDKWLAANPERRAEISRSYYERNAEAEREKDRAWREANRELSRERARVSGNKHKEKRAHRVAQRRANSSEYLILPSELKRLYAAPCASCGSFDRPSLDHIIPLTRGGRHSIGNLQTLCFSCNASKNNRTMMEWRMGKVARRKAA